MTTKIACSPLTGRIFCGRLNKAGNAWIGEKRDVTSDVMGSLIEKAFFHGGTFEITGGGKTWTVTVSLNPTTQPKDQP